MPADDLADTSRPTILVVEDEPIVRMVTVAMLEDMGFRAVEAATGAVGGAATVAGLEATGWANG